MEVKDGNELKQAIHDINVQEGLAEIAKEDPDATLIGDSENSIISKLATGRSVYRNEGQFLAHRLKVNHGSLDKLCEELDYDTYDFLSNSCEVDEGDSYLPLIEGAYGCQRIGDLIKWSFLK